MTATEPAHHRSPMGGLSGGPKAARALLADQHGAGSGRVSRRPDPASAPLSPEQEGLWFIEQLDHGAGAYNVGKSVRLSGRLHLDPLRQALHDVVARHEALRTRIVERDGQPLQLIAPPGDPSVRPEMAVVDLRSCPPQEREARAEHEARQRVATLFELDRAPLVRLTVLLLGDEDSLLLLSAHHLICDGQGMTLVVDELGACYDARLRGVRPALPPLRLHFPDYASWQRARLDGPLGEQQRAYWAKRLAGAPQMLELPTDRPRPAEQSFAGGRRSFESDRALAERVRWFAAGQRCTPTMVLLAALYAVLTRYSGQTDIVVGMPVARRTRELAGAVGMFANTVALRADTSGDPTVVELLARVRRVCMGAFENADLPFDAAAATASRDRSLSHNPLFQVMFVPGEAGYDSLAQPAARGLAGTEIRLDPATAVVDLTWVVTIDDLYSHVDFNPDLFDDTTIGRLGGHLRQVLAAMIADPAARLWDLPLVSSSEEAALAASSGTPTVSDAAGCLVESFVRQAAETPDAVAVLSVGASPSAISYRDLERCSRSVAARLVGLGRGREDRVALLLPSGVDAIVALLGVLRAGAAYVPLDPAHPPARLAELLADSGAGVLITAPTDDPVPAFTGIRLTTDDAAFGGSADRAVTLPTLEDDQLAYVVYTSGSTGEPKGVMVQHGSLRNLTAAFREVHGFGPDERMLAIPPLSFDASVGCVFPTLTSGGALVLHPAPVELTGTELLRLCREHGITIVNSSSPLWQRWVSDLDGEPQPDSPLTTVILGGDRVPVAALDSWTAATGGTTVFNHYGPTEATVCATTMRVAAGSGSGVGHLPIGRPIPGVTAYVLDQAMRPAPIGVPGELYLGGAAPARGYLGRPAETAQRFVPDPFSDLPGARLYRTGDLARFRHDGRLEFVGRRDGQVKIRGHRVELAEVEAAVAAHPLVREVAVVAQPDRSGLERLVAFVVPGPGGAGWSAELRAFALTRLPDYMVPSVFVGIDRLPVTRHGKLDTAALPAATELLAERPFVPPRTDTERRLSTIWSAVLDCGPVGATDNFFQLGGHSLLAAKLTFRIRAEFGTALPIRALFETADLADLATVLDTALGPAGSVAGPGSAGPGVAGSGLAGSGSAGPGVAGSGAAGPGLAGAGMTGPGAAGPGLAGLAGLVAGPGRVRSAGLAGLAGLVAGPGPVGLVDPVRPVGSRLDLRAEAQLPDKVCAELRGFEPLAALRPSNALLTGGTGFLGAYLLADLLTHTEATVHCLVRTGSAAQAAARVRANLERYGLWRAEYARRVVGLPGDLAAPRLGLTRTRFDALGDELDVIFHSGGTVNFVQPYGHLAPTNVNGTIEVLRLAGHGRTTPVHLVSTLGVYLGGSYTGTRVTEADRPDDPEGLLSGYERTKWVSDALARRARDRGLPVSIHRPARIAGDSRTGVANDEDYFSRLVKTVVQLGIAPAGDTLSDADRYTDLAPVDHIAAGIGALSRMARALWRDFHFYNSRTMSVDQFSDTLREYGYTIRDVPSSQWQATVTSTETPLSPFVADEEPTPRPPQPQFDCETTESLLADAGLICPPADPTLLRRYLDAFVESGFLPTPPH